MKSTAERNREIKKFLTEKYGKGTSVTGGRGTAYGWVHIKLNGKFTHDEIRAIEKELDEKFADDLDTYSSDDGYGLENTCLLVSN